MKAVIYTRVSTQGQDFSRQIADLELYAKRNDIEVVEIFTEKISGTKQAANRAGASSMLSYLSSNDIDIVLVSEISRLGRNTRDVQSTIHHIVDTLKINLYVHQFGLSAYMSGKKNPMFQLVADVLANIAEMENEQRRERIMSGLRNAKAKGIKLGRKTGTTKTITDTKNYKQIKKELGMGTSIRKTAKICDVSPKTVQKVKAHLSN